VNLFELDPFTLPSGRVTHFKIECDVLTVADWASLARLAVEIIPPFGSVEGVPRGGIMFAEALEPYVTKGKLLIADDVWVTGMSMERHRAFREANGIVAFTRTPISPHLWVKALISLSAEAEEATYRLDRPANWWREKL
jgi:hypothetical protein